MSAAPINPNTPTQGMSARDAAEAAPVDPGLDDTLHKIWQENRSLILGGCVGVLALILGWGAWQYFAAKAELGVGSEFENATTADQWRKFTAAHPGHALAAIAQLRIADDAYEAGRYAEAEPAYQTAATALPAGPFRDRARLGLAMAQAGADKTAVAEAALKSIADDTTIIKEIRAEAAYQLASLAAAAGRPDDVAKYADQVMQIDMDPQGPWMSRAMALKLKAPASAEPTAGRPMSAPTSGPASLLSPTAPKAGPDSGLKLTIPGK